MARRGLLVRIRDWIMGRPEKPGKCDKAPFWNEPAPATRAGDAPIITSHGQGPSHAH
jgi:hypothetical protein